MLEAILFDNRCFTQADQERFSQLSGDINPMHMDAVAARRTQAGFPAVHGVHIICQALDEFCRSYFADDGFAITGLEIRFEKFLLVGQQYGASVIAGDEVSRIYIRSSGTRLITIKVAHLQLTNKSTIPRIELELDPVQIIAADLDFDATAKAAGSFAFHDISGEFPALETRIGSRCVGGLYALSQLVGMKVPGLHSIFSGMDIRFLEAGAVGENRVNYRVGKAHPHFRLFDIDVQSAGFEGQVKAFLRQPPITQSDFRTLKAKVFENEFAGLAVLVIGGSRGLGEITAKLLAAGGADVTITYHLGSDDAKRVIGEIQDHGGICSCRPFDATEPNSDMLAHLPFAVNQIYYFATSKIFGQSDSIYSSASFAKFCEIYVDGFWQVCDYFSRPNNTKLSVFYPSTIAIDERPRGLTEYTMAKIAGEAMCSDIDRFMPGVRTVVRRLPRLLTDQTATVTPVKSPSADDVMLEIVRAMASLG